MNTIIKGNSKARILFVDDERNILSSLNRLFFDEDYEILLANSGKQGLEILQVHDVEVIVSDQRMPQMTGVDFLIQACEIQPNAIRIILTGYTDIDSAMRAINEGAVYKFITKPWNDADLKLVVKRALEYYYLLRKNEELLTITRQQNEELKELNENLNQRVKERTKALFQKNQELLALNDKLSESLTKIVRMMVSFLEMKSKDLENHCKRVAAASRYLANTLGMSDDEVSTIEIAALLHDIGKISMPEKLIDKKLNLMTSDEMNIWRRHPLLGEQALAGIENLDEAGKIVRHHHENFNGSGFPDGLRGEEIPLGSRIIAVADTFDHLVNHIYLNVSNTRLRALKALRLKMGVDLDPNVVNTMIRFLLERKGKKVERKELELKPFELKENMMLSRDLYTTRGVLVFSKYKRLDVPAIRSILDSERLEKLFTSVYVYV